MVAKHHEPVLCKEIIHALQPRSGGRYVDGTVGAGGHALAILEACEPEGRLLGMDVDAQAIALARETLAAHAGRVSLVQASYEHLPETIAEHGWQWVDGIVLDLGVSSMQLDTPERGFSFQNEAPLDMRFNPQEGVSAAYLINSAPETELADLLFRLGEEPRARRIAQLIIRARPVTTTTELAGIVQRAYPGHSRLHPATRTFQALRIAVNDELGRLERGLPQALEALGPGGRLAVISFHSLEDRLVKRFFRQEAKDQFNQPFAQEYETERRARLKHITRKPIVPSSAERVVNPRARSAKLRVAEKI